MGNRGFDPVARVTALSNGRGESRLAPVDRIAERACRAQPAGSTLPVLGETEALVFASANYLGLTADERVQRAAVQAARTVGTGCGASRTGVGDTLVHHDLERLLAETVETERSLVVGDRDVAYRGLLEALAPTVVFVEACLEDRVERAVTSLDGTVVPFAHGEPTSLERALEDRASSDPSSEESWLVLTPSVCPSDGHVRTLSRFASLATEYGAWIGVDESHAIGLYAEGGGIVRAEDCADAIDVQLGSLSTALASQGGFVAGSGALVEAIVNTTTVDRATALSPPAAATASEALHLARFDDVRERLWENVTRLRDGFETIGHGVDGESHILSFPVAADRTPRSIADELAEEGVLVGITHPRQAEDGMSHLQVTPMARHDPDDIVACLEAFATLPPFTPRPN
ncbi:aminotransferase class I/II-fold pyridoxal phosphate-dependent enzyme [Halovivax limisalsi]|uniref:aminotransferase class I/II-fold pyridoxal phosphate-dependent enzyme n=1 Tax=Halovivax limisalsi TaxID=1453760 RepID=UPI001FFC5041|nr:aminotransferase class I/II-fold pyridoxal phosphate-dependent enzyme [Halovivax limisalsi]